MKGLLIAASLLALTACTSETEFGPCVGIADKQNPALTYKVSVLNTILGIAFWETIVVPVVVLFTEIACPVGKV